MAALTKEQAGGILANLKGKVSDDVLLDVATWVDSRDSLNEDQLSLRLSMAAMESGDLDDLDFLRDFHTTMEAAGVGDTGSIFGAGRPAAQLVAETVVGAVAMGAGTAPLRAAARVPGLASRFNPAVLSQSVLQRAARQGGVAVAGVAGAIVAQALGSRVGGGGDSAASPSDPDVTSSIPLDEAARSGRPVTLTQDGRTVELPGGFDADRILAAVAQGAGSTFTSADLAYMNQAGLGEASFTPEFLTARGLTADTARVAFGTEPNRAFDAGRMRMVEAGLDPGPQPRTVTKRYSFREALNLPETLKQSEILHWAERLWEGGFYSPAEGFDITKPFSEQVPADRYDPRFRQAWNEFMATSLQNPEKTATQILDERRAVRRPLIARAKADALEDLAKESLRRLQLPDPATISESVESTMQRLLGRDPTGAERSAIMERITAVIGEEAKRTLADESVTTGIDLAARTEEEVERLHGAELQATETADAFTMFTQMLGPGGPFGG